MFCDNRASASVSSARYPLDAARSMKSCTAGEASTSAADGASPRRKIEGFEQMHILALNAQRLAAGRHRVYRRLFGKKRDSVSGRKPLLNDMRRNSSRISKIRLSPNEGRNTRALDQRLDWNSQGADATAIGTSCGIA